MTTPQQATTTSWWTLEALDTWFFRDGASFDKGTPWQASVSSVFPPSPRVVSGALRAALARGAGWRGGPWPSALNARYGDWPQEPGELQITGPLLSFQECPLFPAPGHLMVRRESMDGVSEQDRFVGVGFAWPSSRATLCDLGRVRLPVTPTLDGERAKSAEGLWIDAEGLACVLAGELPPGGSLFEPDELFALESRVGLEMTNRSAETVRQEGDVKLYSPRHVRPRPGLALVVGLNTKDAPASPLPLGGEARMARAQAAIAPPSVKGAAPSDDFALVQLTPALWPNDLPPRPGEPLPGLPATTLVSAVADRPVGIGGWDGRRREPLPLRPASPAGSVFFCEGAAPPLDPDGFLRLGDDTAHGFGLFTLASTPSH